MEKTKFAVLFLVIFLLVSVSLNIYQYLTYNSSKRYIFYFWNEHIRGGTIRLEATFEWKRGDLAIMLLINDDDYENRDYLGLVFDKNKNGAVDTKFADDPYILYAYNKTNHHGQAYQFQDGFVGKAVLIQDTPSPYHTATFDTEVGYTFRISFSKEELNNISPPTPVHLCFVDYHADAVSLRELMVIIQFEVK